METFGTRLAMIRKEHHFTQNEIADRLNISAQAVSKWENDLTLPDINTLVDLADIFDMTVDELVGKKKSESKYVEPQQRKDINAMMLRITVDSKGGDKVRINLPMAIIKVMVEGNSQVAISGNKALANIDFNQIWQMVQQGLIGELVTIESSDGDFVTIFVD